MVMPFFSNNTGIVTFVLTGYGFVTMYALRAFSITRQPNASGLRKARPERCMVLKSHVQGSDFVF